MIRYRNIMAALGLVMNGCSAIPSDGPRTSDIEAPNAAYTLIDLDTAKASIVTSFVNAERAEAPIDLPPGKPLGRMGPGDLLKIVIWEPNMNGTSLASDKSGIETIARIATDGTIGVPYVGRMPAAGRTPRQLENDVTTRLAPQSPGAQDVVLVVEDVTNNVIVQGDVAKPGRYPVVPNSSGLLDILAMAGGTHILDRQTQVRITRGNASVTRTLTQMVDTRAMEMDFSPGDRILIEPRTAYFYAFGAVNRPGEQPYNTDDISLAHTLGRIQGLADQRADPASIFIYRRQKSELTRQLSAERSTTDVIYRLNLRDPAGFFVSEKFPVLPEDLPYVSMAPIAEAAKVIQLLVGFSNLAVAPRNLGAPY